MSGGKKEKEPRKKRAPMSRGMRANIWAGIAFLLTLGMLTTVIDLAHLPAAQTRRANEQSQRAVIDPATGVISLGTAASPHEAFDVAEPTPEVSHHDNAKSKQPKPDDVNPDESKPAEANKPDEVKSAEPTPDEKKPDEEKLDEPKGDAAKPNAGKSNIATPDVAKTEIKAEEQKPAAAKPPAMTAMDENTPKTAVALRTEPLAKPLVTPPIGKDSLVAAPAPEITETVDGIRIPKRGIKDATPASIYAQPFHRKPEQILICFVVMEVGLDTQSLGLLLDMPKEVTIAYSPYARNSTFSSTDFRNAGHEVWTMLPTMGEHFPTDDPGPMGLVTRMPKEELLRRLHEAMAMVAGSVGMVMPADEAISSEKVTAATVLGEISGRGLFILSTHPNRSVDQLTGDKSVAADMHRADMILDAVPDESQIKSKLAGLLASAQEKGEYVVVLSARPQTITILRDWLKHTSLTAPLTLAPLSAIYQSRLPPVAEEKKDTKKEEKLKEEKKPEDKKPDAKKDEKKPEH